MRVCHVLDHSLPHTDGYAVRSAAILRFQSELGLEPVGVTSPFHPDGSSAGTETIDGQQYHRTPHCGTQWPVVRELSSVNRLRRRLADLVSRQRPHVLHAHSSCLWGLATLRVARSYRLPFVYEIRSFWEDDAVDLKKTSYGSVRYRLTRGMETFVARRAHAVVTIAERMKRDLMQRGIAGEKIFVVPNAIDSQRFAACLPDEALRASLGLDGCVAIGYIGSFYRWEGVDELVRAMPSIIRRCGNGQMAKLLIIGRGEDEELLRSLIDKLDLHANVNLLGAVPNSTIQRYYSLLDILVYPRRSTRLTDHVTPLKPLEAMAMGKAVLASDVGGLRELLPEGTGCFFRPGVFQELAEKCVNLINNPQKRAELGRTARQYVCAHRDWRNVVRRYSDVYAFALRAN